MRSVITGIDAGTATIRVVVAEPRDPAGSPQFSLLGYGFAPATGLRRGAVVDAEEAARSIRLAINRAGEHAGVAIDSAYLGFGGSGFSSVVSKGVVAVSRADGEICEADIERAHAAARANLPTMHNREIMQELTVQYVVDKETGVKQPVGMIGNRLEAHMLYSTAFTPHLRNLVRAVEAAGISVNDIAVSPLVSAYAMLSKHQREIGVLHLDLGGETATCTVFEEGVLVSAQVFPVGAMHVTGDIAIGFQVPLDVAEAVKVTYGAVAADESAFRRDIVRFGEFSPDLPATISRWDLSEVVEARTADIFELVEKYLRKMGRAGLLPAGVVLSGGGAHVPGMVEFSRRALRLPAQIGTIRILDPTHELVPDPSWAVAVGLAAWACATEQKTRLPRLFPKKVAEYIMRVIRPLIP